tara:strand:+ start:8241 stop:10748 length:2508 start_codon:yes stop_codon:yes gene_type:complete
MSNLYVNTINPQSGNEVDIADNLSLKSDGAILKFGASEEIRLTHVSDHGLNLKHTATSTGYPSLTFQTGDTVVSAAEALGSINFQAPDATAGGDSQEIAAAIRAIAESTFTSTVNKAYLSFLTGESEAATEKMRLFSNGDLGLVLDSAKFVFGSSQEITLTHEHNTGLILTHTATGDNTPIKLTLKSEEDAIIDGEVIGAIDFKGGDSDGTDAIAVCAGIEAVATDTHAADNNAAKLSFKTAASEAAAEKMALSSAGDLSLVTDGASIKFGADSDIILTHDADSGLTLTQGTDATAEPVLTLKTVGDLLSGPTLHFLLDNGAGEDDEDTLGTITFSGDDSTNSETIFAQIKAHVSDVTNADEGGGIQFRVAAGGTGGTSSLRDLLNIGYEDVANSNACEVTVNDSGIDCDFRIESDTDTYAFFLQGSDGKIGIGNPVPGSMLEISKVSGQPSLELSAWSATATAAHAGVLKFQKAGTATLNTFTGGDHTTAGEILGRIEAYGVDDDDGATLSSYIEFANDAVSDADSSPGKIVFATSDADDAGTPTVRLTIDDDGLSTFTGDLAVNGDTTTFTSANSTDPLVVIKNTTNDANGARLQFVKDKGAAGADGDDIGVIEFVGDDAAQTQTTFAKIVAEVSEADDTDEAGKLSLYVAESDGTNTALAAGLVLEGEHATDGQVDVTIGAGSASTTSVVGGLTVAAAGITATKTAAALLNNSAGAAVTPSGAGGDCATLTMNGIRSGTVTITLGGNFTNSGGEALGITVNCDQVTANDVIVCSMGQSGASTSAANIAYMNVSPNHVRDTAAMTFWVNFGYGTYDYDAGNGSEVILLNWALL